MVVDLVYGFLGSGKTTFITRVLNQWGADEKIVVLVNEFGNVGIDGDLLSAQGGSVVEMPSGCICCTLRTDFRTQLREIARTIGPDRIIIEPSGVATVTQIQNLFLTQIRDGKLSALHKILVADATGFMDLYRSNRYYVESQVQHAHIALLNKCDRVKMHKALLMRSAISAINPDITVFMTRFGAVDWPDYRYALASLPKGERTGGDVSSETVNERGVPIHSTVEKARNDLHHSGKGDNRHHSAGDDGHHHHDDPYPADPKDNPFSGYESFSLMVEHSSFDQEKVETLFQQLSEAESAFGQIVRAKGIFQVGNKWRVIELASAEISSQPIRPSQQSKIAIIGKELDRNRLRDAINGCLNKKLSDDNRCPS